MGISKILRQTVIHFLLVTVMGAYKSTDAGKTFSQSGTVPGGYEVNAINGNVYVGTEGDGIYLTTIMEQTGVLSGHHR